MSKRIRHLDTKLRYARAITWITYVGFLISLWTGSLLDATPVSARLLAIVSLPLLLFLPGMARQDHKSLAMLSFVTLMYFVPLVVNVGKPDYDGFDVLSLTLICILFTSSMMFSRWVQYHRAGLGEAPSSS